MDTTFRLEFSNISLDVTFAGKGEGQPPGFMRLRTILTTVLCATWRKPVEKFCVHCSCPLVWINVLINRHRRGAILINPPTAIVEVQLVALEVIVQPFAAGVVQRVLRAVRLLS